MQRGQLPFFRFCFDVSIGLEQQLAYFKAACIATHGRAMQRSETEFSVHIAILARTCVDIGLVLDQQSAAFNKAEGSATMQRSYKIERQFCINIGMELEQ